METYLEISKINEALTLTLYKGNFNFRELQ